MKITFCSPITMSVKNPNSIISCFSLDSNSFLSSSETPGRRGGKKTRQFTWLSKTNSSSGRFCLAETYLNSGGCRHLNRLVRRRSLNWRSSLGHIHMPHLLLVTSPAQTMSAAALRAPQWHIAEFIPTSSLWSQAPLVRAIKSHR